MNQTTHTNGNGSSADGSDGSEIEAAFDRAVGAVIGSAVGDALGAGYEGTFPHRAEKITMRGAGPGRGHRSGAWTDDTANSSPVTSPRSTTEPAARVKIATPAAMAAHSVG